MFATFCANICCVAETISANQHGANSQYLACLIGGIFVILAVLITIGQIVQHLLNYTKPQQQLLIIGILSMVLMFQGIAWMGLVFPDQEIYLDAGVEFCEAIAIFCFITFLWNVLRTDIDNYEAVLEAKPRLKHTFPLCCLPLWKPSMNLMYRCRLGVLQYSLFRPILAIIAIICESFGYYHKGEWIFKYAFPYLLGLNVVSQVAALYSFVLIIRANREELMPVKAIMKFFCIKVVIFIFSYQRLIITFAVERSLKSLKYHEIISESCTAKDIASSLQDYLICVEMFLAAILYLYAFSHKPYAKAQIVQMPLGSSGDAGDGAQRSVNNSSQLLTATDESTPLLQHRQPQTYTARNPDPYGDLDACSVELKGGLSVFESTVAGSSTPNGGPHNSVHV